ncbi:lysozyme inhibitor LprI family protein [Nissabacter sp. SGAir0207]|uniref:lysozyme inhibitor LprI family protein n=1 Tax=Nissabacter sp. SGAir0207 TaxID=2126321 RepID=UPI0010CD089E|nr:lysozyme inhibitor LprI family protein [Nissabacter sp. SGAir0207]QCR38363.1 hypothetical protein C1N62_19675 [Nissabacter sp. SGAir0207]
MKRFLLLSLISFSTFAYENCTSENTAALEQCSYNNYKLEDGTLNYLYQSIIKSFPAIKNEVMHSQRLWLKARDEICAYTPDDGAEYKINQNACLYQQTYERNRELSAIITKEVNRGVKQPMTQPKWDDYIKYHCEFMGKRFSDIECKDRNQFLHSVQ